MVNGLTKDDFPVGSWVVDWRRNLIGRVDRHVAPDEPWDMRLWIRPPAATKLDDVSRVQEFWAYAADLRPANPLEILAAEVSNG